MPILEQMPIGCRLGPRCPFAQRECIQKPSRIVLNSMNSPAIIRSTFENGSLKIKWPLHRLRSTQNQKETNNAIIESGKSQ